MCAWTTCHPGAFSCTATTCETQAGRGCQAGRAGNTSHLAFAVFPRLRPAMKVEHASALQHLRFRPHLVSTYCRPQTRAHPARAELCPTLQPAIARLGAAPPPLPQSDHGATTRPTSISRSGPRHDAHAPRGNTLKSPLATTHFARPLLGQPQMVEPFHIDSPYHRPLPRSALRRPEPLRNTVCKTAGAAPHRHSLALQ